MKEERRREEEKQHSAQEQQWKAKQQAEAWQRYLATDLVFDSVTTKRMVQQTKELAF